MDCATGNLSLTVRSVSDRKQEIPFPSGNVKKSGGAFSNAPLMEPVTPLRDNKSRITAILIIELARINPRF
jgi:hypothetical protein